MAKLIISALSGALATIPMTLVMTYMYKRAPQRDKAEPEGPRIVTMNVAEVVGVKKFLNEDQRFWTTLISHFSYGTLMGILSLPVFKLAGQQKMTAGILYGLSVWTGSYRGWLPAVGLVKQQSQEPIERNIRLITTHLVWGAFLGLLMDAFEGKTKEEASFHSKSSDIADTEHGAQHSRYYEATNGHEHSY